MNLQELFTGIGIVIDDNVNAPADSDDRIVKIVKYLEDECHIPLVKYETVPHIDILNHCQSINFILLDWSLLGELPSGGSGSEAEKSSHEDIISFLNAAKDKCFAPIFLFSNEDIATIQTQIQRAVSGNLPILFKSKSELIDSNNNILFWSALEEWFNSKSGIYVQKTWNQSFEKARVNFMISLNKTNAHWPKVISKTAELDSVNPSDEINNLIVQNLLSRMNPVNFDLEQINLDTKPAQPTDLISILEFQRFCPASSLSEHHSTGDVYKINEKLYINIRPACDCVPRDGYDGQLYLLECNPQGKKENFNRKYGNYSEKDNEVIIGPILNNHYYSVKLKKFIIGKLSEYRSYRVGRIQHPFITKIIQRYGLYLQRQGLPRIPLEAIYSPEEIANIQKEKSEAEEG